MRFTASIRFQISTSVRENGALSAWPALLTSMSMRGKRSRIFANALWTDSGSVMSAGATSASADSAAACFSSRAASRPIRATPAPSRDERRRDGGSNAPAGAGDDGDFASKRKAHARLGKCLNDAAPGTGRVPD